MKPLPLLVVGEMRNSLLQMKDFYLMFTKEQKVFAYEKTASEHARACIKDACICS
jgi:hypothetical protein